MEKEEQGFFHFLLFKLLVTIVMGILLGKSAGPSVTQMVDAVKQIMGDFVGYTVPLIILNFITPVIASLKEFAGEILTVTLIICYLFPVGAAYSSFLADQAIVPNLHIQSAIAQGAQIPEAVFKLKAAPIVPVMTTSITAILFRIAVVWAQSKTRKNPLMGLNQIVLTIVKRVVTTVLPAYIATTFTGLAYEEILLSQFPVFIEVIFVILVERFIWMALLYNLRDTLPKSSLKEILKHYVPTCVTAVETMSSAATVSVALVCARKSTALDSKIWDFVIPLCSNTHLCESVLTETFSMTVVSRILYGQLPLANSMILFIPLLGVFAVAAPGAPREAVVASLGLVTSVLHFDGANTVLILSIFTLQDSFGTTCNIIGGGAIALMVTGIFKRKKTKQVREA